MKAILFTIGLFWLVSLAVVDGIYAQTQPAAASWESKSIDKWDEADIKNILRNSPWSRMISGKQAVDSHIGTLVVPGHALFTLRSSLIVRYAIVRSQQLLAKYDSMDAQSKRNFNSKFKPVLDCAECDQYYIVAVVGDRNFLRTGAMVKHRAPNIYLSNEKGERRELAKFSPQTTPGSEALFFFNRFDSKGRPLVTAENLTLTFNFRPEPGDDSVISVIERVEFRVADIVREAQVIF